MKYIIIKALLGFGDRLECLIMYTEYAIKHNLIMCIDWSDSIWSEGSETFQQYFQLDMPQIDLKDIPSDLKVYPEIWKDKLNLTITDEFMIQNRNLIDLGILTTTFDCDILVVVSSGRRLQYPDCSFFYKKLKIIHPEILEEIEKRRFVRSSIAIHLRGTDRINTPDFKVRRIKQLQLKLMKYGVFNDKKIIVSDDQEFIRLWKQFDNSPALSKKLPKSGPIHTTSCEYSKDELNIQLIIDFITLSMCKKVFSTSEDSRFAKCAEKARSFF